MRISSLIPNRLVALRRLIEEGKKLDPAADIFRLTYTVSLKVICSSLGLPWAERHIMGTIAPTDFFKNDWLTIERQNVHALRVIHLAEMIFNLQGVPGCRQLVEELRTVDAIEPKYAELEVGKLLYWSKIQFKFITPSGSLPCHDLEIEWSGSKIFADTKCRIESTERSVDTTVSRLKAGLRQLPKSEPGMFFVRFPQTWNEDGRDDSSIQDMQRIATRLFRSSSRVVGITFFYSLALDFNSVTAAVILAKYIDNPNHRHSKTFDWNILSSLPESTPSHWVDFIKECTVYK